MKRTIVVLSLLLLGMPARADALPLDVKIGVSGAPPFSLAGEAELGWAGMPFKLAGQAFTIFGGYGQMTGWGEFSHAFSSNSSARLLAGANLDWRRRASVGLGPPDTALYPGRWGYLIGAFYAQDWGSWWMRMAPSISLVPLDPIAPRPDQPDQGYVYQTDVNVVRSLMAGPPWLEVGYRVMPGVEVSLQSSLAPLKASVVF